MSHRAFRVSTLLFVLLLAVGAAVPVPAIEESGVKAATPEATAAETPKGDPAADFFLSRCAGCHTIGEGVLTGPDLATATGWAAADLAKAVTRMQKNVGPMTGEQVASLVELLKDETVKERLSAARERRVVEMAATLEPASPATGRELFEGERPFSHGGAACAACHRARTGGRARGGTLAVDLTDAATRLGESGVASAAENPGFPLMRAVYARHPVTRQEAVHLAAYLAELAKAADKASPGAAAAGDGAGSRSGLWGTAIAVLALLAVALVYRGRNRGVRARLVREAHQR